MRATAQPAGAVLEASMPEADDAWQTVCSLPCESPVEPGLGYRVSAPSHRSSDMFRLREGTTSSVSASLGSSSLRTWGWVLTPLGGLVSTIAISSDGKAFGGSCEHSTLAGCKSDYSTSYVVSGVGVAVLAVGIWAMVASRSTVKVESER